MMAGIGQSDTKPEMLLRRGLHAMGYRYRLHVRGLPGRPDLVFSARRAVIFVNGCFWHGHDCHLFRWPGTRIDFWREKISSNVRRDRAVRAKLRETGWRVCEVWECQLREKKDRQLIAAVFAACAAFLAGDTAYCSVGAPSTVTIDEEV